MDKTKYMLIRKTGKNQWTACYMENDSGHNAQAGKNSSKAAVEAVRDRLTTMYPECKYAVLEVMED